MENGFLFQVRSLNVSQQEHVRRRAEPYTCCELSMELGSVAVGTSICYSFVTSVLNFTSLPSVLPLVLMEQGLL